MYDACKGAIDESHSTALDGEPGVLPCGEMPARVPLQSFGDAKRQYWNTSGDSAKLKIEDVDIDNVLHCRALLRSPFSMGTKRPQLWAGALQVKANQADRANYELLRRTVVDIEYLSDKLLIQGTHNFCYKKKKFSL